MSFENNGETFSGDGSIILHSQKEQLTKLYIFISVSFVLSSYSEIVGLDD